MSVTDLNEWKERGQRKWGPLSNLPRVDAIFEACERLDENDEEITRDSVREMIGGGSDRDIGPVLKLYKSLKANREEVSLQLVPSTIVQIIAVEVESQLQKFKDIYDEQFEEAKSDFLETSNTLSESVKELEEECGALQQTIEGKDTHIDALTTEIANKEKDIAALQEQLKALDNQFNHTLRKNEELSHQLLEKEKTIAANAEKHEAALAIAKQEATAQRQELTGQHDKEIDRLMTLLGNERGEWRQAKREWQDELSALNTALQERQRTVDSQSATLIQLNKELLTQNEEIGQLKSLEEQQTTLQTQLRELTVENRTLQKDNQRLSQQLPVQQELLSQIAAIQKALTALQDKSVTKKHATTKTKPKKGE